MLFVLFALFALCVLCCVLAPFFCPYLYLLFLFLVLASLCFHSYTRRDDIRIEHAHDVGERSPPHSPRRTHPTCVSSWTGSGGNYKHVQSTTLTSRGNCRGNDISANGGEFSLLPLSHAFSNQSPFNSLSLPLNNLFTHFCTFPIARFLS